MSSSPRSRARKRLLKRMLREVVDGDYLNGDHMERFNTILSSNTPFRPASVFMIGAMEDIEPVHHTPHIQILPWQNQDDLDDVGHWVVAYHDGTTLFIYDSAKTTAGTVSSEQCVFLHQLFPGFDVFNPTFVTVQKQPNGVDCGLFAIANATSIALGRDPAQQWYDHRQMRRHLASMLGSGELQPFPTTARPPVKSKVPAWKGSPVSASASASASSSSSKPYFYQPEDFPALPFPKRRRDAEPTTPPAQRRRPNPKPSATDLLASIWEPSPKASKSLPPGELIELEEVSSRSSSPISIPPSSPEPPRSPPPSLVSLSSATSSPRRESPPSNPSSFLSLSTSSPGSSPPLSPSTHQPIPSTPDRSHATLPSFGSHLSTPASSSPPTGSSTPSSKSVCTVTHQPKASISLSSDTLIELEEDFLALSQSIDPVSHIRLSPSTSEPLHPLPSTEVMHICPAPSFSPTSDEFIELEEAFLALSSPSQSENVSISASSNLLTLLADSDSSYPQLTSRNKSEIDNKLICGSESPKSLVSKRGRPKKSRGRPKQSEESHDEQISSAKKRYTKKKPEVHRESVKKYNDSHPEIHAASDKRYRESNRNDRCKSTEATKSIPANLRKRPIIGTLSGGDLLDVHPYRLKNQSLLYPETFKCSHCTAPLFEEERGRGKWCCGQGAYQTNLLPPIECDFYNEEAFLRDARSFNNLFSFSAIGFSGHYEPCRTGVSFVKILGRTYHRVFDLSWQLGPNNGGLYIDDGTLRMELAEKRELSGAIMNAITDYLNSVNPFISQLRRLDEEASEHAHIVFQQTTRRVHGPVLGDMPRANEIAAIINLDAASYTPRDVVIWKKGNSQPHHVSIFHPAYECLQYPLLFPHGTEGWHIGMQDRNGKKITQVKYYRHFLLSEPRFTQLRRLGQEYFVDMYCRTEEERLKFIYNNQSTVLRIATREDIDETIAGEGGAQPGRVYLPSSFTNSSRYMQVKYQDGMAIVHRLGKPTFFLTVTCNPNWPEIKNSLNPGEYPNDRPDLCDRVFQLKLQFLLNEIKSGRMFGKLIYILHVIEFQKRGLPHAHICFKVEHEPVDNSQIDSYIRGTIPVDDARLKKLVLEHMVHGPACHKRTDLPCIDQKTKKCSKGYPKPQTCNTYIDEKGFVHYKRDHSNKTTVKRGSREHVVSDLDIVPYNPAVLLQMECHANLELANTRKIVKYLFKYIHKGPDSVRVNVIADRQVDIDEINEYVSRRYVGASDAVWRILEFDVTGRYPSVIQLPIHLPNRDHVVYRPGDERVALEQSKSKLTIYMERPHREDLAGLTYCQFYEKFILDTKQKKSSHFLIDKYYVTPRKRGQIVARIYWVSPNLGELFYLRMLLQRFPCFSFEDIRTVEGQIYATFQEAARAHGLLMEEQEFSESLLGASIFMTGRGLRRLFYVLISNGAPAVTLWELHKELLCEDFLELQPDSPANAYALGLRDLDRVLRSQGSSLREMGLPEVPDDTNEIDRELTCWSPQQCSLFVEGWLPQLSDDQLAVLRRVQDTWEQDLSPKVIFVDGAGGTGKTLLLNVIASYFRSHSKIVLCTATTGVAALLYDGGVTAHSKFKLPLDTSDDLAYWSVSGNSQRAELIRQCAVIIWDEAPMANRRSIDVLERSLRNLMNSRDHFGGKIVVFSGDFRQIPPVIQSGTPSDSISLSLKRSTHWQHIFKMTLSTIQRARNDSNFSNFLLEVGEGRVESVSVGEDVRVIPLRDIAYTTDMGRLIDFVFPPDVLLDPDTCCGRAILSGTNANIREFNRIILDLLPGEPVELLSADTCVSESTDDEVIHTELLNTISQPRIPDHRLVLKVGAICILMRNLCFDQKLVNGTKLVITDISRFFVTARRCDSSEAVVIPRITFKFSVGTNGMEMVRRQFPLQLAYGLTINKSQGQTLNVVGVDLRNDVFAHGQLYVALSRARSSDDIRVLVPPERVIHGVAHCANVVYRQLVD